MRRLLVALALALGALAAVPILPAQAGSQTCSTVVLDPAGVLADQRRTVESAAAALGQLGAVVRVRAMDRVLDGDIDAWMRAEERRCPEWLGPGGLRRTNLLVVAVATEDRKTGLWYGDQWRSALDGRWQAVQVESMNPLFKQGQFGAGMAAGLGALAGEIASPAVGGGPALATTTTVFRDAVRRPDYVAEPEYVPEYGPEPGGPSWDDGGGSGPPAGFVLLMVLMGVGGLASTVLRVGGSSASGRSGWYGAHHHGGHMGSSGSSSSGGGNFSGGGGGSGGSSGGGGGSTSW